MSTTSVKILQAASEILGSDETLAERMGIGHTALAMFMDDRRELPDSLLLRVVDIILEDRQAHRAPPGQPAMATRRLSTD